MATREGVAAGVERRERGGWAALRFLRWVWERLVGDARAMGRAAWARWLRVILVGLVLDCALAAGLTLAASRAEPVWLGAWDARVFPLVVEAVPLTFSSSIVLETPGNLIGMFLLIATGVVIAALARRPVVAATLLVGYYLGSAAMWSGWLLWSRERPDLVAGGIAAPGLHSFPSGHMVHTVAVYGYLAYLWCRAARGWAERILAVLLWLVICAAVGLARLVLGVHWPSDVIAGALVGAAWAVVLALAHHAAEGSGARMKADG